MPATCWAPRQELCERPIKNPCRHLGRVEPTSATTLRVFLQAAEQNEDAADEGLARNRRIAPAGETRRLSCSRAGGRGGRPRVASVRSHEEHGVNVIATESADVERFAPILGRLGGVRRFS